jgi:hypothetical protein
MGSTMQGVNAMLLWCASSTTSNTGSSIVGATNEGGRCLLLLLLRRVPQLGVAGHDERAAQGRTSVPSSHPLQRYNENLRCCNIMHARGKITVRAQPALLVAHLRRRALALPGDNFGEERVRRKVRHGGVERTRARNARASPLLYRSGRAACVGLTVQHTKRPAQTYRKRLSFALQPR